MGTAQGSPADLCCAGCGERVQVLRPEPLQLPPQCEAHVFPAKASLHADVSFPADFADQGEEGLVAAALSSTILDGGFKSEHEEARPQLDEGAESQRSRVSVVSIREEAKAHACVPKTKPDFTGEWKMVRCEGDFDAFLKEAGVGWALRKAAGAVGYGVNSTYHSIHCTPGFISVETKNPKGTFLKQFRIDSSEQDDEDPVQKKPIKVIPYWEDAADRTTLTIQAFMPMRRGDPLRMPLTRRYLEGAGATMVVEQTSPDGITVKRFFAPR